MTIYKQKKSKFWWVKVERNGKKIRRSSGSESYAEAKQDEARARIELEGMGAAKKAPSITLGALVEQFLHHQTKMRSRSIESHFRPGCHRFLRHFKPERLIDTLGRQEMHHYQSQMTKESSAATSNRNLQVVRRMFTLAVEWGLVERHPLLGVKTMKESAGRLRFLNLEEQARLVAACQSPFRELVIVAMRTGMRRGEQLALTPACVDFNRNLIEVFGFKTGKIRYLPMVPQVREIMEALVAGKDAKQRIFTSSTGEPYSPWGVAQNFRRALRRSKIETATYHDLRHTFASDALASGSSLFVISKLLGHASTKTTERYAHLADKNLHQAVGDLASYLASYRDIPNSSEGDGGKG